MSRVQSLLQSISSFSTVKEPILFDMGSTTTRVIYKGTLIIEEPTCIAIHKKTREVVAIGAKAVSLLGKVSTRFDVVFPVREGSITNDALCILFLEALFQKIEAEIVAKILGFAAIIVVPTNLSPVQRTVYADVFSKVGFRSVTLLSQSEALLAGLGDGGSNESFCYFDLGGQKSECTIFTLNEPIESRQFRIGGVHLTELVQREVRLQHNLEIGWHSAEKIKKEVCTLASFVPGGKRLKATKIAVRGKDVVTQAGKTVVISSDDFIEVFGAVVEELLDELQFFFSVVPAHLVASTLESGLHITGGMSEMAGVKELIEITFSAPIKMSTEPRLDIIKGLAQIAAQHA